MATRKHNSSYASRSPSCLSSSTDPTDMHHAYVNPRGLFIYGLQYPTPRDSNTTSTEPWPSDSYRVEAPDLTSYTPDMGEDLQQTVDQAFGPVEQVIAIWEKLKLEITDLTNLTNLLASISKIFSITISVAKSSTTPSSAPSTFSL